MVRAASSNYGFHTSRDFDARLRSYLLARAA